MAQAKKAQVIIITGPTAVGKSAISLATAKRLGGEIISADSMQIYQQMNIGTAKLMTEEQEGIEHHLLDIVDPGNRFTVADFQQRAFQQIKLILGRNSLPIVTGGTGLYLHSLLYQMDFTRVSIDDTVRKKLEREALEQGTEKMYHRLRQLDPEAAERIHPHNTKRIIRALEVKLNDHQGIKDFSRQLILNSDYDFRVFVINQDRQSLYQRINQRVNLMIQQGLEEEVRHLLDQGYDPQLPSMQGVGYKEMIGYIQGKSGYEEAIEMIKKNSRRYAKRQITWFKKLPHAHWMLLNHEKEQKEEIERLTEEICQIILST